MDLKSLALQLRQRGLRLFSALGLYLPETLHYIGGSDVLPAPLPRAQEEQTIAALAAGDEAARRTLIEHNLRLVVYIARRFESTGVGLEDLVSIGTIGLIKAINTFKPDRNIKLATYASRRSTPTGTATSCCCRTCWARTTTSSCARLRRTSTVSCCTRPSVTSRSASRPSSPCASVWAAGVSARRRRWPTIWASRRAISRDWKSVSSPACGGRSQG